jgi:ADP-heptose:LPS heptosyltransferase
MREWARERYVRLVAHTPARRATGAIVGAAPRVLLVRPDHLGDVLLTAPAIAALRQALPHARLEALVGPWGAEALAHSAEVDLVRTLDFPGFDRQRKGPSWVPYVRLERAARDLRAQAYDAAVILRPDHWWGAALAARAGIPRRVGYALAPGAAALTDALAPDPREHAVRAAWRLALTAAALLGSSVSLAQACAPATAPLRWMVAPEDRAAARRWLAAHGLVGGRGYLIAHPGAGAVIKQWSVANWARALDLIAARGEVQIVLAGTRAEGELVTAVAAALPERTRSHVYISESGIGVYAALIADARLMLGVDSGPLHLAVALDTPSVRLYGPTEHLKFGPWGSPERHVALASALPCAPCDRLDYARAELPWHPCMALLTPEVVAGAALRLAARSSHGVVPVAGGARPTDV